MHSILTLITMSKHTLYERMMRSRVTFISTGEKISTDTHEIKFPLYKAKESTKDMAVSPRLLS